jgi:hypothetical protein
VDINDPFPNKLLSKKRLLLMHTHMKGLVVLVLLLCAVLTADALQERVIDYVPVPLLGGGRWIVIMLNDATDVIESVTWCKMLLSNAESPPDLNMCQSPPNITLTGTLYPSPDGALLVRRPKDQRDRLIISPRHVSWESDHQMEIIVQLATDPQLRNGGSSRKVIRFNAIVPLSQPSSSSSSSLAVQPHEAVVYTAVEDVPFTTAEANVVVASDAKGHDQEQTHSKSPHHWIGVLVIFGVGLPIIAIVALMLHGGRSWRELAMRRARSIGRAYLFSNDNAAAAVVEDEEAGQNRALERERNKRIAASLGGGATNAFDTNY